MNILELEQSRSNYFRAIIILAEHGARLGFFRARENIL
jgi:hypothetical protein